MAVMQSPPGPRVRLDGREVLYFAGTGYLGLQGDPRVIEAACEAARRHGIGAATTRTGLGETPLLQTVEERAAAFFGAEAALYVVAGYAGMSILAREAAKHGRVARVLADEWLHLAGEDAAALLGAPVERFRHGDAADLRLKLAAGPPGRVLVMCDGVSPVRGDVAPVNSYLDAMADRPEALLLVDDAHGVGVLGRNGRGTLEHAADQAGRPIAVNRPLDGTEGGEDGTRRAWMCGTLSKAVGGAGGIVPGSAAFVAALKADARWYHGAAASAAPVAGATAAALEICRKGGAMRRRLARNAALLRAGLSDMGLACEDHPTPIICVRVGDGEATARVQRGLLEAGVAVAHSRSYPGVDADGALRIAVFATHTPSMIRRLLATLRARLAEERRMGRGSPAGT